MSPQASRARIETKTPSALDVCGVGKVNLDSGDDSAVYHYIGELAGDTDARWKAALISSADNRARAVGLFLETATLGNRSMAQPDGSSRDALAELAMSSGDPAIYGIAVRACNAYAEGTSAGSCQQISVAEWARVDPTNAVPWLLLANQARSKSDRPGEIAAFSEAAKATEVNSYASSLYGFAQSEIPSDATPVERSYLAVELIGYEAAWPTPEYAEIGKGYCTADAVLDHDVREACSSVAELIVSHGKTILDIGIGRGLGRRVGWPPDRVAELTREIQLISDSHPLVGVFWDCQNVALANDYMIKRAALGEVGAAHDASGL
jgi:hypothetical protein